MAFKDEETRKAYYKRPEIIEKLRKYYKKRNKERSEYYKIRARIRDKKLKMMIITHYTKGKMRCQCSKCDVKELGFLTVDHINNDGTEHRKKLKNYNIYKWIVDNNYPNMFQILCYNCNLTKGHYGKCSHFK